MSRKCTQIISVFLLICSFATGQQPSKQTILEYLKPWCVEQETSIENLQEKFSQQEGGACNLIVEFAAALNELYDENDLSNAHKIEARVLLGLIYVAYEYCNKETIGLPKVIRDCIEILIYERPAIGKTLAVQEWEYLVGVYKNLEVQPEKNNGSLSLKKIVRKMNKNNKPYVEYKKRANFKPENMK
jgi:hypothetical protein